MAEVNADKTDIMNVSFSYQTASDKNVFLSDYTQLQLSATGGF